MQQNPLFYQAIQFENLLAAFEHVKSNHGCKGSDGITRTAYHRDLHGRLHQLQHDLEEQRYHPWPLIRISIPKNSGNGVRYLSIPTVRDRIAQTAVYMVTKPTFEHEFENVSHAYRENRGVYTAIDEIKYWRTKGYVYVVDADVHAYFDNVPHDLLLKKLAILIDEPPLLRLFRKWIKAEIYDGKNIWRLETGIPQGSVVSPVFANLYLDELDETLLAFNRKIVRYADDFVILSKTEAESRENIELTEMLLEDLQLKLNTKKTKIVSFQQGFRFLGALFFNESILIPEHKKREKHAPFKFPPKLTLKRYLELKSLD